MKRFGLLGLLLPLSLWAMQTAPLGRVEFGSAAFSGSGCPVAGSIRVLDQAKMIYEIVFDGFIVDAGSEVLREFDRKVCNIAIPLQSSVNTTVAVTKLQYAGFNKLANASSARVFAEAFFAGTRSPMIQKAFFDSGDFSVDLSLSEAEKSWSLCNVESTLRLSLGGEVRSSFIDLQSTSQIDGKLIFQLEMRQCE